LREIHRKEIPISDVKSLRIFRWARGQEKINTTKLRTFGEWKMKQVCTNFPKI
jgi:hypothetical protein